MTPKYEEFIFLMLFAVFTCPYMERATDRKEFQNGFMVYHCLHRDIHDPEGVHVTEVASTIGKEHISMLFLFASQEKPFLI